MACAPGNGPPEPRAEFVGQELASRAGFAPPDPLTSLSGLGDESHDQADDAEEDDDDRAEHEDEHHASQHEACMFPDHVDNQTAEDVKRNPDTNQKQPRLPSSHADPLSVLHWLRTRTPPVTEGSRLQHEDALPSIPGPR